jgi:hypothetical protein
MESDSKWEEGEYGGEQVDWDGATVQHGDMLRVVGHVNEVD